MGIAYEDDSRFVERCSDFAYDIGFEKVKVQLGLPKQTVYLAFHSSVLGSLAIILVTGRSKLDNVNPGFQFAGEFAEIITRGWQINSKLPTSSRKSDVITTFYHRAWGGQSGYLGGGGPLARLVFRDRGLRRCRFGVA